MSHVQNISDHHHSLFFSNFIMFIHEISMDIVAVLLVFHINVKYIVKCNP